ncbi:IS1182 family transposase [Pectinatus frisingensis]|uniref:IS1182 family transposase n=1 Tax=Pectinatus frisingensis TaxID=865 RepID=UPI0015F647A6|nr:IS1182 family transposase [Pectinatus frisingensis]
MYEKKNRQSQKQIQFVALDDLVPKDHILRAIDEAIDFSFIYDEVEGMYSTSQKGNLGVDPVSLFKIVFIQYLFGIRSMRQTIREIDVNVAYRWFIGYGLMESVPHFTTFGKNYKRRFEGTDIFERVFYRILDEAQKAGFVDTSAIFIDGTHIKANANRNKKERVKVDQTIKNYQQELEKEIDADRKKHGKKPTKKGPKPPSGKSICKSKTDPESGLFVKGEHERCFAYVANTACDKNNFILDFVVGAGNIHDSQMFHGVYKKLDKYNDTNEVVALDAGYKTPAIMREIIKNGKIPSVPYKRPMTKQGFFRKYEYVYDEYYDCMICPANQVLKYSTTNKEGYREYKSDAKTCKNCSLLSQCTNSKNCVKVITSHVWSKYMELAEEYRYVPKYRDIYKLRSQTIERVFADAKEKHAMRYTRMSGLEKIKLQVTLTFACMNLKKLAMWKKKKRKLPPAVSSSLTFLMKKFILRLNFVDKYDESTCCG